MAKKNNTDTFVMRGKLSYAKVLGDPVLNYSEDGNEWKFDFVPNDEKGAVSELKRVGVADRIKSKDGYLDGRKFISFKQKEYKNNGERNDPIEVVDAAGNPWPQDKLLGNETVVDCRFVVVDFGVGKFKGMYPRSLRVLEHVPYERKSFDDLDESDPYFKAAKEAEEKRKLELENFRKDFGLTEEGDMGGDAPTELAEDPLDDEMPI